MRRTAGSMRLMGACAIATGFVVGMLVVASPAYAYKEPNTIGGTGCTNCHPSVWNGSSWVMGDPPSGGVCVDCHGGPAETATNIGLGFNPADSAGPHGGYLTTTRKCATCHSVHDAPAVGIKLLPAATVYGTCFTCHDGTGGWGVYGALAARSITPNGSGGRYPGHRYEAVNSVPGGDPVGGGASSGTVFEGSGGTLTCSDCHSPHGSDVVAPFIGERRRIRGTVTVTFADLSSTRLLRRSPTGAPAPVSEYGSDWCLTCHQGRASGGSLHNHPVESAVTYPVEASRFIYRRLAVLDSGGPTFGTALGQLGGEDAPALIHDPAVAGVVANTTGNRGLLMPWPRSVGASGQSGHKPICQQCHEDTRDVGDLAANGSATVVPFNVAYADSMTWDGSAWVASATSNPRFQNFPHETENPNMLVENADDLCLNCHPSTQLP